MISGLLASTALTLIAVPALYTVLFDDTRQPTGRLVAKRYGRFAVASPAQGGE